MKSTNQAHAPRTLYTAGSVLALLLATNASAQEPEQGNNHDNVRYDRQPNRAQAQPDLLDTRFQTHTREAKKQRERAVHLSDQSEFRTRRPNVEREMADKQIEFMQRLIKTTDQSDPEYPDYLFRLADHYLEKKQYFELQVGALYQKIYDSQDQGDVDATKLLKAQQQRHAGEATAASQKAAQVYAALVDNQKFSAYKRMDEALYYYAFELGQLGEEQDMQDAYKRLINDFPSSPYIGNAYLAFADYYYEKGQIGDAVRLYERVIQIEGSPVHAYALYKLGWCHLNPVGQFDARYDKSLSYFVDTINAANEGRAGSEANAKQLRRDARRDLVRAYVHASKPSKAWAFFTKVGNGPGKDEQDARRMMELLANQYFGDGQYTESTYIYAQLQSQFPDDPMDCEWQGKIVINTLATDNKEVQWQETERLASAYTKLGASDHKKSVKKTCRDNAHATMKQMATVWHDEAEKTHDARTYELAQRAYETFLASFPSGTDSYEMQYFYAELLWAQAVEQVNTKDRRARERGLEVFLAAHQQFVKTLELDPKGKYTADAAYAQMLAMKNYLEYDELGAAARACKPNAEGVCEPKVTQFPETDYTEDERQMLAAYDVYTKYVHKKDDKELPKIMYHRAKLMMSHNKFDQAQPLLVSMISKFDDVEDAQIYAVWGAEMLVDLLTIAWLDSSNDPQQDLATTAALEQWLTKLQGMKVWNHPENNKVRTAAPALLAAIGWRKGAAYGKAGASYVNGGSDGDPQGFEKCAQQFIEVFNNYADHDRADTLLWNAAECSDAAYQVGQAIQIRNALLDRFPNSPHAKDTLHHLAQSYQAVAYYDQSAERYEQFAEQHGKDPRASDALQNAYLFRLGLGQERQAKQDLGTYESLYKRKDIKKAATIFWSEHALLSSRGARRKHAEDYLKTYGTKGGLDRAVVAEAVIAQIDWRRSCDEPLLYDSCITIDRKRALVGVVSAEQRKRMQAKQDAAERAATAGERVRFHPPKYCGSATQGVITVHRRSAKFSAAAQARFKKILALIGTGERIVVPADDPERATDFNNAWAMAMVYQADQQYEQYLRVGMPEDLDFVIEDWRRNTGVRSWEHKYAQQVAKAEDSTKRVSKYLASKLELGGELQQRYAAVTKTGSPYWTLAAAARTASLLQNFADQLYRAQVPSDFKTQEQVWAYCDALADHAEPLQEQALSAYEYCIERSTEYQFFNEFSRLCEEEMQQRDAERYPATNELFGVSIYTASRIGAVEVLEDSLGGRVNPVKRGKQATKSGS